MQNELKTVKDIMDLIISEHDMSKGKIVRYVGSMDLGFQWVSFTRIEPNEHNKEKRVPLISNERIDTVAQIQYVYWAIWCHGRSSSLKQNPLNMK